MVLLGQIPGLGILGLSLNKDPGRAQKAPKQGMTSRVPLSSLPE
ncbi:MAG: hypothetical protein ACI9JM_000673 [Halioglobus sp.]|jgi:hypothetical protein